MDPYALIVGTALAVILLTAAGFALAAPQERRRADIAGTLAIPGVVIAAAVLAYAAGIRAHVYHAAEIVPVEIIQPTASNHVKSQPRVARPRFSQF